MSCPLARCMNGDEIHTTIPCHFSFTGSIRLPELFDVCINHIQRMENRPGIRAGALTLAPKPSRATLSRGVGFQMRKWESVELWADPRAEHRQRWGCWCSQDPTAQHISHSQSLPKLQRGSTPGMAEPHQGHGRAVCSSARNAALLRSCSLQFSAIFSIGCLLFFFFFPGITRMQVLK